jgi:GAF domain-containing protein
MNLFNRINNYLLPTHLSHYSAIDQQRIRTVLLMNGLITIGIAAWAIIAGSLNALLLDDIAIISVGFVGCIAVSYFLRRGAIAVASYLLTFDTLAIAAIAILFTGSDIRFIFILPPMILAGLLLPRAGVGTIGLMLISVSVVNFSLQINDGNIDLPTLLARGLAVVILIAIFTGLQARFVGHTERLANASHDELLRLQRVIRSVEEIDPTASPDDVFVEMIRSLRGVYQLRHVSLYLLDNGNRFTRRGRGGMRGLEIEPIADNDILTLDDTHFLSEAARTRKPVQTGLDAFTQPPKHFEPDTIVALAIPMIDQDRIIGVVDIQIDEQRAFSKDEIDVLSLIIATFARLFVTQELLQQQRLVLSEQEVTTNRVQTQLASFQSQRQQMVSAAWGQYLEGRAEDIVGFDQIGGKVIQAGDMPEAMRVALEAGDVYTEIVDNEKMLSVPIQVRGETLGAMTFALPREHIITERQIELTRIIADRLGTSLESTRLLEQTQLQATRERKASEVASQLYGATDMNVLLRLAADSFNEALGAIQTRIFIEPNTLLSEQPGSQPPTNGNGHHRNGDSS